MSDDSDSDSDSDSDGIFYFGRFFRFRFCAGSYLVSSTSRAESAGSLRWRWWGREIVEAEVGGRGEYREVGSG